MPNNMDDDEDEDADDDDDDPQNIELSAELERVMKLGDVPDLDKVSRLQGKVNELKSAKSEMEKSLEELTKKNDSSASQIFALLTEKLELLVECRSLEAGLRDDKFEVEGLNATLDCF
ncbi:hypothetical protein AgCh_024929 [Apium graveolens]